MDEKQKAVAVVTKLKRDPFAEFRPAAWKRPFYYLEDLIERSLSQVDEMIVWAQRDIEEEKMSLTWAMYILLVVIICATLVSIEVNKIGIFN